MDPPKQCSLTRDRSTIDLPASGVISILTRVPTCLHGPWQEKTEGTCSSQSARVRAVKSCHSWSVSGISKLPFSGRATSTCCPGGRSKSLSWLSRSICKPSKASASDSGRHCRPGASPSDRGRLPKTQGVTLSPPLLLSRITAGSQSYPRSPALSPRTLNLIPPPLATLAFN